MAEFFKGQLHYSTFFGIHEECANICFRCRGHNKFRNVAQGVDGAVGVDWFIIAEYPPEEVMDCSATLCTSFLGIGRVTVDIRHHG